MLPYISAENGTLFFLLPHEEWYFWRLIGWYNEMWTIDTMVREKEYKNTKKIWSLIFSQRTIRAQSAQLQSTEPETKEDSRHPIPFVYNGVVPLVWCIYHFAKVIALDYIRPHQTYSESWKSTTLPLLSLNKMQTFDIFKSDSNSVIFVAKMWNYIQSK